jgi:Family of unknown function (DUF6491)
MNKMLLGLGVSIAATAAVSGAIAFGPAERRAKELAAYQPAGEPVNCVSINRIRSTKILNNQTIDFKMAGGKVYRNTLPSSCPGLVFEDRFSYRTSTSQLCNVDIIRVLENQGGRLSEGAGCGLGKFQPVEKIPTAEEVSYSEGEWQPFEVVEPGDKIG